MSDKLKKLIKNEVFIAIQRAFPSCIDEECVKPGIADKHEAATEATDSILSLLAPELEKARKWDRVKEIAKRSKMSMREACSSCMLRNKCDPNLTSDSLRIITKYGSIIVPCVELLNCVTIIEALTEKEET